MRETIVPISSDLTGLSTEYPPLSKAQILDLIRENTQFRTGIGYDVHRFAEDRRLILGGVDVPHTHGLLGHSDADVVTHAAIDAVLGAAGCSDIGTYFPDDDPRFKDADSIVLAKEVCVILKKAGYRLEGLDLMVVTEVPKLKPHIPAMKALLATTFGLPIDSLGIKATTNESMGWIGRGEGIACLASALVRKIVTED